eukprot:TRINITY_DN10687_c0_g1_i1.p1 TRINITY_DN10687_c0_g1~~TRINITY_DN10687_c0_g1_i1.p1  ORF type:complete len:214 (+),score=79.13 TRINITY_DN10687_c0_g1_i1:149-790(+)
MNTECNICFDNIRESGDIGCHSSFCFKCIKTWSETNNSCPICRERFNQIKKKLNGKRATTVKIKTKIPRKEDFYTAEYINWENGFADDYDEEADEDYEDEYYENEIFIEGDHIDLCDEEMIADMEFVVSDGEIEYQDGYDGDDSSSSNFIDLTEDVIDLTCSPNTSKKTSPKRNIDVEDKNKNKKRKNNTNNENNVNVIVPRRKDKFIDLIDD